MEATSKDPGPAKAGLTGIAMAAVTPALLVVYLSFNAGGFFVGAPAFAAVVVGVALTLRVLTAEAPFAGFGPLLVAAVAALGLYAVWTLVSAIWSDSPAAAMIEFNRALLYWLTLVLFGTVARDRRAFEWAIRSLAIAITAIGAVALVTRLLPDVISAPSAVEVDRLSYPLTYWNALGILMTVGLLLCLHLASSGDERPPARVAAAAAIPLLAATIYFSFSRGAILAAVIGVVVYAVVARPRLMLSTVLAVGPPTALLLIVAYGKDLLATDAYDSVAGIVEGHSLALLLLACCLAAALLRAFLAHFADGPIAGASAPPSARRWMTGTAIVVLIALVGVGVALNVPAKIGDQYDSFTTDQGIDDTSGDLRGRLTDVGNNGRLVQWRVAVDAFAEKPLAGEGAGTFPRIWALNGDGLKVEDAHSLYVEVLAELGIVGFALIITAFALILAGLLLAGRAMGNAAYAGAFAAAVAWMLHAGIDWDWEMPATGIWIFALGGMALSRSRTAEVSPEPASEPSHLVRVVVGIGCLVLLITPALMALSQRALDDSVQAFKDGDCRSATQSALSATDLVSARPEPYEILAYCNSRAGDFDLALQLMDTAISRDRQRWSAYYSLAVIRAAAGKDPREAAERALALSPQAPLAIEGVERFDTDSPQKWRRRALSARLPIL